MASLLDALLGRPAQSIDELNGSKLGQIAQRFKYANNPVGTETNHQIGLGPVDRLMEVAQSPQVQNMVQIGSGMGDGGGVGMIRAYHGSPHKFDRFDLSRIGTGEGAQAYGHGLYFAGNEGVARYYRDALSPPHGLNQSILVNGVPLGELPEYAAMNQLARARAANAIAAGGDRASWLQYADAANAADRFASQVTPSGKTKSELVHAPAVEFLNKLDPRQITSAPNPGHMYEVNINAEPGQLLDWDKPIAQQPIEVRNIATTLDRVNAGRVPPVQTGQDVWQGMRKIAPSRELGYKNWSTSGPADYLKDTGIPGIQYLDAGSRGAGEGSRNYVIFDDKLIDILRRYAFPGMVATGAMAAVPGESQ